jgi:hypothetical protein
MNLMLCSVQNPGKSLARHRHLTSQTIPQHRVFARTTRAGALRSSLQKRALCGLEATRGDDDGQAWGHTKKVVFMQRDL